MFARGIDVGRFCRSTEFLRAIEKSLTPLAATGPPVAGLERERQVAARNRYEGDGEMKR